METATAWLLKKLAEEGRTDLIEQYHAHNRAYQRSIAIKSTERQIAKCKDTLAKMTSIASPSWRDRVQKQLASYERLLAKQLKEQE